MLTSVCSLLLFSILNSIHFLLENSFMFYGPSPALTPALVTRRAAKGAIVVGMLVLEIGGALANVPAFTAMHVSQSGPWKPFFVVVIAFVVCCVALSV